MIHASRWSWVSKRLLRASGASRCSAVLILLLLVHTTNVRILVRVVGIRRIVMEKLDLVGLAGDENKFPGEISGGMRKRAGLARSLVLDPQIILCDEPDSGLDPVRAAYLSQLLIDINAQIDCTILIVTHNINIARTVPDKTSPVTTPSATGSESATRSPAVSPTPASWPT